MFKDPFVGKGNEKVSGFHGRIRLLFAQPNGAAANPPPTPPAT
jgi:hypothetical protein